MEKLEQVKPYQTKMDLLFKELYEEFNESALFTRDKLPKYRGVYVFYEKGKPIYVGRANNIYARIQGHTRPSSGIEKASFAFNLAKNEYSNNEKKTRKELMLNNELFESFKNHKLNLATMEFKCIFIENDILQTMFEPYLAFKLGTYPINNTFENH